MDRLIRRTICTRIVLVRLAGAMTALAVIEGGVFADGEQPRLARPYASTIVAQSLCSRGSGPVLIDAAGSLGGDAL